MPCDVEGAAAAVVAAGLPAEFAAFLRAGGAPRVAAPAPEPPLVR